MQSINQSIDHASQLANLIHLLACLPKLARVHAKDYRHGCGCDREKGDRGYGCSFAAAYGMMHGCTKYVGFTGLDLDLSVALSN
jgi:hypothetical protein